MARTSAWAGDGNRQWQGGGDGDGQTRARTLRYGVVPIRPPAEVVVADTGGELSFLQVALPHHQAPPATRGPVQVATVPSAALAPLTDGTGDAAMRADIARARYGATGVGVKVGILSDSFDLYHGAAMDVLRGDLPGGVTVLEEGAPGGHDEGRAMANLVHRVAPGARILFHTATSGEADFAAGIDTLRAAGCQVIVDDVAYLDEPFYQLGGVVQQAVARAVAAGVDYFTAASNEGGNFLETDFQPIRTALPGLPGRCTAANLGTASAPSAYASITIPPGGRCALDMQWDQPWANPGGGGGSTNSLAMVLYDANGNVVAAAGRLDVRHSPVQTLQYTNTTGGTSFRLAIVANAIATPPGLFKVIAFGQATLTGPHVGTGSGAATGHELVPGANTVGAIEWSSTARYGGNGAVEGFSSRGPGEFLFDPSGRRLSVPVSLGKVDFVAPDGGLTSVFDPFYGTSAAAPNAAAVAALMLQENPALAPADVTAFLKASALPAFGAYGAAGAGLIQADAAVGLAAASLHH